jgi:ATP-binding cassette subfamily B protein/subfamily B ATP-binding cassette protein MsbA
MHRSSGAPPADTAAVKTRRDGTGRGSGRRSRWDLSTLRELWRFKDYGRPERRALALGMLMNGGELAADLAAPWPLALVINDLLKGQGQGQGKSGMLHAVAGWFGGSPMAMLSVAAGAVLIITPASGVFSYLGDMCMNGAGQRITSRIRAEVFAYTQRLPMAFHDRQTVGAS